MKRFAKRVWRVLLATVAAPVVVACFVPLMLVNFWLAISGIGNEGDPVWSNEVD